MNASTKMIFRYRRAGQFYSTITVTLQEIQQQGASEIMTQLDGDDLKEGITWEAQVGTLLLSSPVVTTGEPYESLDYLCVALDAIATLALEG